MPEGTSIRKFFRAARSGHTDITKVLTQLFRKPWDLTDNKYQNELNALSTQDGLKSSSNPWGNHLEGFIQQKLNDYNPIDEAESGLTLVNKIIAHIKKWPNDPSAAGRLGKEQLRQVLVAAINADSAKNHSVQFFWKLESALEDEDISIVAENGAAVPITDDPDAPNGINSLPQDMAVLVTFISPWSKVRDEALGANEVEMAVGPEE